MGTSRRNQASDRRRPSAPSTECRNRDHAGRTSANVPSTVPAQAWSRLPRWSPQTAVKRDTMLSAGRYSNQILSSSFVD